jgi:hypothetical protein
VRPNTDACARRPVLSLQLARLQPPASRVRRSRRLRSTLAAAPVLCGRSFVYLYDVSRLPFLLDDYWDTHEPIYPSGNQPSWGYCTYSLIGGPSEIQLHCVEDMGLTQSDVLQLKYEWNSFLSTIYSAMDAAGAFAFASFTIVGTPGPDSIASNLATLCAAGNSSSLWSVALFHQLTIPSNCCPPPPVRNTTLLQFSEDLAYFMLVRGPWAWIGYSWDFCAAHHTMPPELFLDYGDPVNTCEQTTPGVFVRVFEHAVAAFDTNTYKGAVTML